MFVFTLALAAYVLLLAYVGHADARDAKRNAIRRRMLAYGTVATPEPVQRARQPRNQALIVAAILGTVGVALMGAGVSIALGHDSPTRTDAGCMRLMAANALPLDSKKADWLGNYHGCQQVYDGPTLVGYGVGDGRCNRAAYALSMRLRLTGSTYHAAMGRMHCVLYEDWSWSAE